MKKVIFFCLCILFSTNVYAYGAVCELLMDADSGRVLYAKNGETKKLIASTTKIMTALITLNYANIKETVTVGDEVLKAYGSTIYIKLQEKLTLEDLLYGLMLRSGNDAAIVIANYVGGSEEGFAKLMNDTALSIDMHNTEFQNPHGLDDETKNMSTTHDMALLLREAMKNKNFKKITSTHKYALKTNFNTYFWYNKNKLLNNYEFATGGKIGTRQMPNTPLSRVLQKTIKT